jgi:membrane-associated phospholipid phosphatase
VTAYQQDTGKHRGALVGAAVRLVPAAVLIWLILIGVGHLLTHQWRGSGLVRWDKSVDRSLAGHRGATFNTLTHYATFAAETTTVIAVMVVAIVVLRLASGGWRASVFLAVTVIGEVTIFVCTTLLVERPRPDVGRLDSAPPTSSFPSGHTAASVALYASLAVIAFALAARPWLRALLLALALLVPVAVALSRLYRGMHYPTDVIAGASLSLVWLAVTSSVLLAGRRPTSKESP